MEEVYQALVSRQVPRRPAGYVHRRKQTRSVSTAVTSVLTKCWDYSSAYGGRTSGRTPINCSGVFQSYLKDQRSIVSQVIASNVQTIQVLTHTTCPHILILIIIFLYGVWHDDENSNDSDNDNNIYNISRKLNQRIEVYLTSLFVLLFLFLKHKYEFFNKLFERCCLLLIPAPRSTF